MGTGHLRVVLTMETSLLTSAIQQCLADNPRLQVEVHPPGDHALCPGGPAADGAARTVQIGLLDDPVRFALQADGREWIVDYQSLDGLARLLADLGRADVVTIDRP
jgi:hypothetical protein